MLTVIFNINSSSRRQEYSKFLSSYNVAVHARYVTTVHSYTRTRVLGFYEQIGQLTIIEQSRTTNNCRFYCDNLTKIF